MNLVHNASQVTPKGQAICVKAHVVSNKLAISVCDQGPGVPAHLQNKIFEPFYTTKTHGTGLGLAVVKSVVNAHNGQLTVSNLAHGGACFTIAIPCSASQAVHSSEHKTKVA